VPTHLHPGVESAARNFPFGVFASAADRPRDLSRRCRGRSWRRSRS